MKCKSWSNKINNFVVRRLKSIKINGQQQQQQIQQQQQQTQQQHQYLSTCSTMPAMPKEKATAVSLNESNFNELKLKELTSSATVVAAMATTAASRMHHLPSQSQSQPQQQQYRQQQQQHQSRSVCGCGAASAEVVGSSNHGSSKYVSNGHSSPLAAANAATQNGTTSPQRSSNSATCCPSSAQQQQPQQNGHDCCDELRTAYTAAGGGGGGGGGGVPITSSTSRITPSAASASCSSSSAYSSSSSSSSLPFSNAAVTPPKKSPKDFIFGKYIGEGSFSSVYLAVDINTKRDYAIKVCEKRHILREHKQEYVRREREVMHMMTNVPGFVNLSCTFQDSRSLFFVMTYAKNGDLLPYITKVGSFDMACTRHYVAELVLACEQMHRRNVVHRDLKPENILLDEDMHTLIADFGSAKILTLEDRAATAAQVAAAKAPDAEATARTMPPKRPSYLQNRSSDDDDDEGVDDTNDTGSDEDDASNRRPRYHRKRRGSFVGTAQYVSPEVLQNGLITPAADLWALGCIVYQMISGLPPFRGSNDYVIFREILACNLDFPAGFDKDAEDLVRNLLKVKAEERLGANDFGGHYDSIRSHPFFDGIDFDAVRQETPPPIIPYLPGVSKDDDFRLQYHQIEHMEPGLDDKQRTRLLGMELGTSFESAYNGTEKEEKTVTKNIFDLSEAEKLKRLEQQKSDKWHVFADNEVILRKGFINKRKGLFARKRMLLLTTGPRLIYIDPVQMIKKGEIPWSAELRVEPKNFKIFFVHTPNRTYYLEDPDGYSLEWVAAIEKMHKLTYPELQKGEATAAAAAAATTSDTQTVPTSSLTPVTSSGALSSTKTTVSN